MEQSLTVLLLFGSFSKTICQNAHKTLIFHSSCLNPGRKIIKRLQETRTALPQNLLDTSLHQELISFTCKCSSLSSVSSFSDRSLFSTRLVSTVCLFSGSRLKAWLACLLVPVQAYPSVCGRPALLRPCGALSLSLLSLTLHPIILSSSHHPSLHPIIPLFLPALCFTSLQPDTDWHSSSHLFNQALTLLDFLVKTQFMLLIFTRIKTI